MANGQEPAFCTAFTSKENDNVYDPFSAISSSNTQESLENETAANFIPSETHWIPSSTVINQIKNRSDSKNYPRLPILIAHFTDKLTDNVALISKKYLSDTGDRSLVFTSDQVDQNQTGLLQLISSKNLNAALNLTAKLIMELNNKGEQSLDDKLNFLEVWQVRIGILIKLKKFKEAEIEARYFENFDQSCFYREDSENLDVVYSLVPFTFRVLLAELEGYNKRYTEALDKLVEIEEVLSKLENSGISGIERDFGEELECIQAARNRIYQGQGKPQLCQPQNLVNKLRAGIETNEKEIETAIDRGLIKMFNGEFDKAYDEFLTVLGDESVDQAVVVSNTALALLYQGQLQQAIQLLESRLDVCTEYPIIKNLTQLLDIRCNDAQARKIKILERICHQIGDSFETECFNFL